MNAIEINNNLMWKKKRDGSLVSVSSASSYQSDSSEDNLSPLERKASLQDIIEKAEDSQLLSDIKKKCRSMSDGEAVKRDDDDDPNFEVFPSLPNSVLEKMGLHGNSTREHLNEEELEQKFTSLSLAFAIDGATIKNRCERQRRRRDQTENNLTKEIDKFKEKLALMQPLCVDIEKAELMSTLLTQIDLIMKATAYVSTAAERYGSVQHEDRLTESVSLMVKHVQMLKQQRDSAKRQLQYTKRVLQTSPDSPVTSPIGGHRYSLLTTSINKKVITKRRASIATFSDQNLEAKPTAEIRKVTRRTSELSLKPNSLSRSGRPLRLELGGDLLKISESYADEPPMEYQQELLESESDSEHNLIENECIKSSQEEIPPHVNFSKLTLREKLKYKYSEFEGKLNKKYQEWTDDGTLHEIFCFFALLCFSVALLTMVSILIEYEYAKRGLASPRYIWAWFTEHPRKLGAIEH